MPQVFSDGSFKLCAAAAQFDNNLHLLFLQNPEKKTNLILGVPGAQMPAGQQVMVKVSVDGKVTKEKGAVISQPEAIAIPLADDPDLVRAITAGNVLSIEVPGDTATFQMKGATKALKDLGACIDQAKAGTLKLPAPAQPPIPPALAKMLVEAGLKDARAIPIDKIPPQQRPGDFAWQLGERVLGSVRSFPLSEEAGDFGAISQKYLDQLKQSCEGNFTPNFGNVENLTAYGLRTGTAGCDSKEGKIHVAMTMQLIPVPKQQGQEKQVRVLNVYTHETVEAEKARADSANQGIYKVLQERGKQPLPTAQAPQGQAPQQGQAKPAAAAPKPAGQ
ncbi:hypothetical protein HHL28_10740 [Aerophototrophica crusticola]|uniref:Uncharacterized protein n=1 Tax=Aerophototrophica crusticola TaxID=1709002 RepID=A0A858R7V6_9PROT|nr:hypothetical protein HHL28_10740 [Rhodospirillaceae bacterium B3]